MINAKEDRSHDERHTEGRGSHIWVTQSLKECFHGFKICCLNSAVTKIHNNSSVE